MADAVDEDDGAVLGEDDVRRAWEAAVVDYIFLYSAVFITIFVHALLLPRFYL